MDRSTLEYLLSSGPSRMFNLAAQLRMATAEGEPALRAPFETEWLNQSIIFKFFDEGDRTINDLRHDHYPTLVFLPYDTQRPGEGGESFFFTHRNLEQFFAAKTAADPSLRPKLIADRPTLEVFNSVPTLSPYLLDEQFERLRVDFDRRLLALPVAFKTKIRARLSARLRPLVVAAFGDKKAQIGAAIEGFVSKLIDGTDREGLDPLVSALRIDPIHAQETFQAWVGITYFEEEFHNLQGILKRFISWLKEFYLPRENLPRDLKLQFDSLANDLRSKVRDDWTNAKHILVEYRESYSELLTQQKPRRFVAFLAKARPHYGVLGDVLGRLEQITEYWQMKTKPFGFAKLPYELCEEFYDVMKQSYVAVHRKSRGNPNQKQHEYT